MNIRKLNEEIERILQQIDPFEQDLIKNVPYLEECEIVFNASASGEVGGEIDYEYGGLKNTYETTEEGQGEILVDKLDNGKWNVKISWGTDHFDIWANTQVSTLQELYDLILSETAGLDNIEIVDVIK